MLLPSCTQNSCCPEIFSLANVSWGKMEKIKWKDLPYIKKAPFTCMMSNLCTITNNDCFILNWMFTVHSRRTIMSCSTRPCVVCCIPFTAIFTRWAILALFYLTQQCYITDGPRRARFPFKTSSFRTVKSSWTRVHS